MSSRSQERERKIRSRSQVRERKVRSRSQVRERVIVPNKKGDKSR